jgi:hypothetical protein
MEAVEPLNEGTSGKKKMADALSSGARREDPAAEAGANDQPASATPSVPPTKSRDLWDKAPVITSILSSVVLAIVGIYISSSFQVSQLAITRENNASQLAITAQKNQADLRLQELKLASDLMESLVSPDPKKRRVAALMLPSALSNHEMCQQILAALTADVVRAENSNLLPISAIPRIVGYE